jgi:hypothetical protein
VLLSSCGSEGYSVHQENGTSLELGAPLPKHSQVFVLGNTGKPIQNLILSTRTHGTLAIEGTTAYIQLDPTSGNVDFTHGAVYLPPHDLKVGLLSHHGYQWNWQVGDLPSGYHLVVGFRTRRIKPKPHHGYVLDINWYAVSSPNQPRATWHQVAGVYDEFG